MLAALEDLLDSWPGTLLVVSHDRYLIERVTDQQYADRERRAAAPARRRRRVPAPPRRRAHRSGVGARSDLARALPGIRAHRRRPPERGEGAVLDRAPAEQAGEAHHRGARRSRDPRPVGLPGHRTAERRAAVARIGCRGARGAMARGRRAARLTPRGLAAPRAPAHADAEGRWMPRHPPPFSGSRRISRGRSRSATAWRSPRATTGRPCSARSVAPVPPGVRAALTALMTSAISSATSALTSGTTFDARMRPSGSSSTTRSSVWIRGSAV